MVATILSAQCTDQRVNQVTPELFQRYPDAASLAQADPEELQTIIRSTGFFRNKSKSLIAASRRLVEEFSGEIPTTMEELLTLPGVARKTANVVLGTGFGIASGVVVDTHVGRITKRLGFTEQDNPVKIEKDLMQEIPSDQWIALAHRLIHFGRRICRARKPLCQSCFLVDLCPYFRDLDLG
jgi:endonuclease-3